MIFPVLPSQSNGIEDARFVEFDEAGVRTYYATYTAYTGRSIRSELLETRDFVTFRMSSDEWRRHVQQGNGAVSPQDRRPVRHDRASGQ